MFHQNIRLPGVYIFNSNNGLNAGIQGAPIYCTMTLMSIVGMNDADNKVLVFPKYKVIFYIGSNFVGTGTGNTITIDNTTGTKCTYATALNESSSCRVYYDNVEIDNVFSTTGN